MTARFVIFVAALMALLAAAEWAARSAPLSEGELRFIFRTEMNHARWSFLTKRMDRLRIDSAEDELYPNRDELVPPEEGRPAFDRIDAAYHLRTNSLGFRDGEHPAAGDGVVLVLGDSVTYGKGVEREERFTSLLQEELAPAHRVVNLGVQGCTSRCMAAVLERFVDLRPALVVVQASMNDFDLMLWKTAVSSPVDSARLRAARLAAGSRALLRLTHLAFGDPYEEQVAGAARAADLRYASDADAILSRCDEIGAEVVVVTLPYATAETRGHPLAEACLGRPEVCLGVLEVSLESNGPPDGGHPRWVRRTAGELGFEVDQVSRLFPLASSFHDMVHPNAQGNAAMAAQLAGFLETMWRAEGSEEAPLEDRKSP